MLNVYEQKNSKLPKEEKKTVLNTFPFGING